ncbi:MAG TPA: nicotinate-nucleotide adenylyltransferase [Roseiflexaceae bacterium]|nr:nicotinate-nucleotide adenylyltransferase [Roseiflexaceae bacterium]
MPTRIGVLGGTFDPIHYGHLAIAEEARAALGLERVLLVPAAQQPFKQGITVTPAERRLEMVRLACQGNPAFEASPVELERPGPSYTVTTLEELHARLDVELLFIVGGDAVRDMPRWRRAPELPALAQIVIVQRPLVTLDLARLVEELPQLRGHYTLLEGPSIELSSTELRARVAAGRPIRYLVPDPVAAYIAEHGLYREF